MDDQLEDFLENVEEKLSPTIEKLIKLKGDSDFSTLERMDIATFVAMMIVRTPQYRKQLDYVFNRYELSWSEYIKGNDPTDIVRSTSNVPIEKLNFDPKVKNYAEAFFKDKVVRKNSHVLTLWKFCETNAKILFEQMQWGFIVAKSGLEFVTCDDPVGRFDEYNNKLMVGLSNKSMCIYFPISPEICFYANHNDLVPVRRDWPSVCIEGKENEVELINHRMMKCAQRDVYSLSEDPGISKVMLNSDPKPII